MSETLARYAMTSDETLAAELSGGIAELEPAIIAALQAQRQRCRWVCEHRAWLQRCRAKTEGNAYAAARAKEADGCAADIGAIDLESSDD